MAEIKTITYKYRGERLSIACVNHVFNYLSSVCDLHFTEAANSPDILIGNDPDIPDSVNIAITKGENDVSKTQIRDLSTREFQPVLNYDPIRAIALKLSIKGGSGPFASRPALPSAPTEKTLSETISDFYNLLCRTGFVRNRAQAVKLWPERARFAVAVTHDIDIARRSIAGSIRLLFNRILPGGWSAMFDSVKSALKMMENPYDAVHRWVELENSLGVKSTYFVFDGRRRHRLDPKYKLDLLSSSFIKLIQNHMEIAVHTSVECFSGKGISQSKSSIEDCARIVLTGLRPHYLSAFFPEYWLAAADAGFAYSSVLGFDSDIGYWDGIDLPFYPFNSAGDESIPILEIPISVMDCGLIGDQPADSSRVFERAMGIVDRAASTGGLIVLDWHQRTFYNRDYPGWVELFAKIVRYAGGKGACFLKLNEIAALFGKRR